MQNKTKKRLIITGIVIAVLAGILLLGYFCVNMGFSMLGDSFYQSEVTAEDFESKTPAGEASGEEASGEAGEADESESTGGAGETANQPGGTGKGERALPFDRLNLSAEEFKALQKKVPFSDKVAALGILSTGLSAADYTELIGMLGGGITSSEVKRAYKIVSRGLSSEDKEKIWGYYDKYKHLLQ